MRILFSLTSMALLLLPASTSVAYQWYHVPIDTVDHPTYELQFEGSTAYAGTGVGVFRGYGPEGWQGMGLEYPGLGAYSILCIEGTGWTEHAINELPLPGATGVAIGDVDLSHHPDVVVTAKEMSDRVVWYENPGPLPPTPHWTQWDVDSPTDGAREVSIGDINLDGRPDLAVAIRDEGEIVWYQNNPLSYPLSFIRHHVGYLAGPRGVFIADINGDSRPDIVAGGMDANTVMWYEAPPDPAGPWTGYCVDDSLEKVKGVYVYDVDGDLDLDIVAAGRLADDVVWYEQGEPGDPIPWTKHLIDDDLDGAVSVWCGDLVGDGTPEVAATAKHQGCVMVYQQPDDVHDLWDAILVDGNLTEACPISAGDFDGDGRTDLVAAGRAAHQVAWYKALGGGFAWEKYVIDAEAGGPMGITAGDVDNDGDVDIVATACAEGYVTWYENDLGDVYCAYSDGTGHCESDGIYHWRDQPQEWYPNWWCARPYFIKKHPHVPGLVLCGNNDGLFASTDMVNWDPVGPGVLPGPVRCIWFHPFDPNIMMAGTGQGIFRTVDAGMLWYPVPDVPPIPVNDFLTPEPHMPDPEISVMSAIGEGSYSDGVFASCDFGDSWWRLNWEVWPTDLLQDWTADGHGIHTFVGTRWNGILRMRSDGVVSGNLNTGLPNLSIHHMCYDPFIDTPAIFACTEGGLYECMLLEVTATAPEPRRSTIRCDAWPNPWRQGVAFAFEGLDRSVPVEIDVYDLLGRRVWTAEGRSTSGGTWTVRWNGRVEGGGEPAPGVYFYRAKTSGRVYNGKIIRVR